MFQYLDDPALNEIRVWKEDAEIVEVFHSNAGDLGVDEILEFVEQCEDEEEARSCLLEKVYESTPTGIGAMVSLGTHDYWPDGGKANHSYCEQLATGKPENLIQYYVDVVGCSHSFAWMHWIASINNKCSFEATTNLQKFLSRDFEFEINVGFSSGVQPRAADAESVNYYYETLPDWPFGVIPLDDDDEEDSSIKATVSVLVFICISLLY
ncbi:Oidioi.mRNA.OKI2018_I69.PAR.g8631.t1.cds [Oikopleura dioica]|uniref:Oidioi.mRNA.OKI2018_I69.PAR.g8631.t1.cds n=1 Tax=Oikopleura dioica TaxID=34765 RepID=A0ABN7RPC4_OIKDI|nr:Oidioi.mRNA.OKI2018_I69.PAR.g8631.t1.cds [Oikopleura dioica]